MATKKWQESPVGGVLLDISGVLINAGEAIENSVSAFRRLLDAGVPVRLVTNETTCTVDDLCKKLVKIGFNGVTNELIFAPAYATCNYMKENNFRPHLLINSDALPDFETIDKSNPNCVVIGDAEDEFSYQKVNEAFRVLIDLKKPILISMGQGKYYKGRDGLLLDVGVYKAALEFACDVKAIVMGKPSESFFMSAVKDMKLSPDKVVMVGDDLRNDIGGAQNCGIRALLVRTGKFRPCDENDAIVKPDEIVDNLAEAVTKILSTLKK